MTTLPLWIILVADLVICLGGLGVGLSPGVRASIEEQARENVRNHAGMWQTYGCSTALLGMIVVPGAWIWYSINVGEWLFVAIGVVPLLVAFIREPFTRRWKAQARREESARLNAQRGDTYVSVINMRDSHVHETRQVAKGVNVDYRNGVAVGVEVIGALAVDVDARREWTWSKSKQEIGRGKAPVNPT